MAFQVRSYYYLYNSTDTFLSLFETQVTWQHLSSTQLINLVAPRCFSLSSFYQTFLLSKKHSALFFYSISLCFDTYAPSGWVDRHHQYCHLVTIYNIKLYLEGKLFLRILAPLKISRNTPAFIFLNANKLQILSPQKNNVTSPHLSLFKDWVLVEFACYTNTKRKYF